MGKVMISVYQNKNDKTTAYNKWYGRVKQGLEIKADVLCQHAAQDSGIEEAHVAMVFDGVLKQIKEQLCNGHPIKVEGLGTFKVGISSEGWSVENFQKRPGYKEGEDPRKWCSAQQVKSCRLLYRPSEDIKTMLREIKFEQV
ncbi:MAG: HU family DNA-binding protein [Prevotella sp.]|nr:HU family DNA-binding protein [Prevotella sp.]MBR0265621.1 HU family DNA-binding protein [Prevotella sp.]